MYSAKHTLDLHLVLEIAVDFEGVGRWALDEEVRDGRMM